MSHRNVEIISASAGTGKTTRLAKIVADAIREEDARPEAILATTFTRRAAAELTERARGRLLKEGRVDEAQRLHAARIGTVNGVCGGLVQDFAFDFGLSPEIRVLDERQTPEVLAQARARVLSEEFTLEITHAVRRFKSTDPDKFRTIDFDWEGFVQRIVEFARANGIDAEALEGHAKRSWDEMRAHLAPPSPDADELDRRLSAAIQQFLSDYATEETPLKGTTKAAERVKQIAGREVSEFGWADWLTLETLPAPKAAAELLAPLHAAAAAHDHHPRLHADLEAAIGMVFQAAAETLGAYRHYKERLGVIDFIDQETYALEMLRKPEIRERLAEEIDLVLVDEFQDTSPIQLAIFLELASIAKHSVWVGDPKQAIYAFRSADPTLMEAAVSGLLEGRTPETLAQSWRSRPGLVHLTSDLFTLAFAENDIDERLVRVAPGREESEQESEALGPLMERWALGGKKQSDEISALATGVAELLEEGATVVDATTRRHRDLQPGDVAILCPKNHLCEELANELARRGIRAVVTRAGLLETLEGRLAVAALRLFLDPRDDLARAQLARWLEHPRSGDAWLTNLLDARADGNVPFEDLAAANALRAAREENILASALPAFDAALAALDLRELCAQLGDADRRLANLDALRGLAGAYVDLRRAEGDPATVHGLLLHLDELADAGEDLQAAPRRPDSVVVSTWHASKGLEWAITVLADISSPPEASALGLRVLQGADGIDLEDPLAGRSLRFWPDPYLPKRTGAKLYERLDAADALAEARQRGQREELRLLYVGWTRARDRLVLAAKPGGFANARFAKLAGAEGPLLSEPDSHGWADWPVRPGGPDADVRGLSLRVRELASGTGDEPKPNPGKAHTPTGPRKHPRAFTSPSSLEAGEGDVTVVGEPETLGERMQLTLPNDDAMADLGDAFHSFLAADRASRDRDARLSMAEGCLDRFGVAGALIPEEMLRASDALHEWVDANHPGAIWHREWPLQQRQANGTVLRGQADLVLETAEGFMVIDHKSFPGSRTQALKKAATFGAQLAGYAEMLGAARKETVLGTFIHLPISGLMVKLKPRGE